MSITNTGNMDIKVAQGCYSLGDGTPDYIEISGLQATVPDSGNAVSVSCWVKVTDWGADTSATWTNLVGKDCDGMTWGLSVSTHANPKFIFHVSGAGANNRAGQGTTSNEVTLDRWTHVAGTYAGGDKIGANKKIRLYIDGEIKDELTSPSGISRYVSEPVYIGGDATVTPGMPLSGLVHDVRIWSGVRLTDDEIRQVYNGLKIQTPYLIGHYKFKDRKGTTVDDAASGDYDGTITGGEWYDRDIRCWCTRWSESDNSITIETFLDPCDRNYLFDSVIPKEIRQNTNALGWEINRDGTFKSGNTLIFTPVSGTGLADKREERKLVVTTITDWFLTPDLFGIRVQGKRLRNYSDYI